jgi:hypothetical protein
VGDLVEDANVVVQSDRTVQVVVFVVDFGEVPHSRSDEPQVGFAVGILDVLGESDEGGSQALR